MIFHVRHRTDLEFSPAGSAKRYNLSITRVIIAAVALVSISIAASLLNELHPGFANFLYFCSNTLFGAIFGVWLGEWMACKELED